LAKKPLDLALGGLLFAALPLRALPLEERKKKVIEFAQTVDQEAGQLNTYESVLVVIFELFKQAVLATPEKPEAFEEFLEWKDRLIQLIPIKHRPEAITRGVYELVGKILLSEETKEPTF
jgi:hypothetical protein